MDQEGELGDSWGELELELSTVKLIKTFVKQPPWDS